MKFSSLVDSSITAVLFWIRSDPSSVQTGDHGIQTYSRCTFRKLLAKVCLVREEIQNLARERAASRGAAADLPADSLRQGVPRRAVAFLKVRDFPNMSWRSICRGA